MKGYCKGLLRIVFHMPYLYAAIAIAMLGFSLPLIVNSYVFGPRLIEEELSTNLEIVQSNLENDAYHGAPEELVQGVELRKELLESFFDDTETSSRFVYAARYYEDAAQMAKQAGETEDWLLSYGKELYCEALSRLDRPISFSSCRDMPALCYLSFALGSMPSILLYGPAMVVSMGTICALDRKKLLHRSPMRYGGKMLAASAVTAFQLCIVCIAATVVPLSVLAWVNGLGNPAFPVVYTQAGTVTSSDVGLCTIKLLLLAFAGNAFLSAVALKGGEILRRDYAGLIIGLLLIVVPLSSWYFNDGSIPGAVYRLLPMTYLLVGRVCGYVGIFPNMDLAPATQLSATCGIFGLLALAALLHAIGAGAYRLKSTRVQVVSGGD